MAKEIKQEILKIYCETDKGQDYNGEDTSVALCQMKWNGREPKGYDIRTLKNGKAYKGISISYDGFNDIVLSAISEGLVDIDGIKDALKSFDDKVFKIADFTNLFSGLHKDELLFKRDKFGRLINKDGAIVIHRKK